MASGKPRLRYHCVSIVPGATGCDAAKAISSQRILSAEAPRLPLATCSKPSDCNCTYRHYDDRREGPRRAFDRGEYSEPWSDRKERRRSIGRRTTDE